MKQLLTLLFALCIFTAFSQSTNEMPLEDEQESEFEYFAQKPIKSHGIYGGIGLGYMDVDNVEFFTLSSRLAYIANNRFEIGIGGEFFTSYDEFDNDIEDIEFLVGSIAGLHMKGIFFGKKKIHFSLPVFLGLGAIAEATSDSGLFAECFNADTDDWEAMAMMDIGLNAEFNINRVIGFEIGAKYRLTNEFDLENYNLNNLNALNFSAMLKVGVFDFKTRKAENYKSF